MTTATRTSETGFTMIELIVVMGLLSGFLMMLVNLMSNGITLFNDGQRGQDVADRVHAAARATTDALSSMIGPQLTHYEPRDPDARLVVSWEPVELRYEPRAPQSLQVLRSTVKLSAERELELLTAAMRELATEELGDQADATEVEQRTTQLLAERPLQGRGEMLLLPWPAGDPDGAFYDLRRGYFVEWAGVQPFAERRLDTEELGAAGILASTQRVAAGVLHFELAMWSQLSTDWDLAPGRGGPELCWDSARAGWLTEGETAAERFELDLGEDSYRDTRDDVWPRWIRITLVVARSASEPAEAVLTAPLDSSSRTLRVNSTDEIPEDARFCKVGSEWIRFGSRTEQQLGSLQRGQRGTRAKEHAPGTRVRIGRTIELYHQVPHGRDNWNG